MNAETLDEWGAEFLILLSALDETSNQIMHARSSYRHDEIVFGAKFRSILGQAEDGMFQVDVRRLSEIEMLAPVVAPTEADRVVGIQGRP